MGIDIIHVTVVHTGICQRRIHTLRRTFTTLGRLRHVVSIATHAKAGYFRIDFCTPRTRHFVFFKHQYTGTVTEYKAIPVLVPGTTGSRGIIITGGERTCCSKPANARGTGCHFRTTGDHDVSIPIGNGSCCNPNIVRRCRTCSDNSNIGTFHAVHNGQISGNHIDDAARNKEGRNFSRTTVQKRLIGHFYPVQTTDAGSNRDTCAAGIGICNLNARIFNSLAGGSNTIVNKFRHTARIFLCYECRDIEVPDFTTEADSEIGYIKTCDRADAAATGKNVIPGNFNSVANRRNNTQAGYNNASFGQSSSLINVLLKKHITKGRTRQTRARPEFWRKESVLVGIDVINCLLDSGNFLCFFIRNLTLEFLFQGHNQFNGIK